MADNERLPKPSIISYYEMLSPLHHQVERHDPNVIILHVTDTTHLDAGTVSCIATTSTAVPTTSKTSDRSSARNSIKCTTQLIVVDGDEESEQDEDYSGDVVSDSDSSYCYQMNGDDMKKQPALILKGPRDVTALVGDRVLLKAQYMGRPDPTVRWTRAVSVFSCLLVCEMSTVTN